MKTEETESLMIANPSGPEHNEAARETSAPDLTSLIADFMAAWALSQADLRAAAEKADLSTLDKNLTEVAVNGNRYLNHGGVRLLEQAAETLLKQTSLQLKISRSSARKAILEAFGGCFELARARGELPEAAVIAGAQQRLAALPRDDGLYVFPIVFAPKALATNFRVGPLRITAKSVFLEMHQTALDGGPEVQTDDARLKALADWRTYLEGYDHLVSVQMTGFEAAMGWDCARDAMEFLLNLVRMLFGFDHSRRIRVGGGFAWETIRPSVILRDDGDTSFTISYGPHGSHLDDHWYEVFDRQLGAFSLLLASFAQKLVDGDHGEDPTFERLRYANRLLAEAYCEPHDPIRLVRTVSALEALSLVKGKEKARQLGQRCAHVGGIGDPAKASQIEEAVLLAYRARNAVVHGDAPSTAEVHKAFRKLEKYLLEIYVGYLGVFADLNRAGPVQTVEALRSALKAKIKL